MSKDEKARETPPWTMFFEGPLYRKYDDFMRHHDFSKILANKRRQLSKEGNKEKEKTPDKRLDPWENPEYDNVPVVSPFKAPSLDSYEYEEDRRRRRRRTCFFICSAMFIIALLSVATALVIHYVFIVPKDVEYKAQVNVSMEETGAKPNASLTDTDTHVPTNSTTTKSAVLKPESKDLNSDDIQNLLDSISEKKSSNVLEDLLKSVPGRLKKADKTKMSFLTPTTPVTGLSKSFATQERTLSVPVITTPTTFVSTTESSSKDSISMLFDNIASTTPIPTLETTETTKESTVSAYQKQESSSALLMASSTVSDSQTPDEQSLLSTVTTDKASTEPHTETYKVSTTLPTMTEEVTSVLSSTTVETSTIISPTTETILLSPFPTTSDETNVFPTTTTVLPTSDDDVLSTSTTITEGVSIYWPTTTTHVISTSVPTTPSDLSFSSKRLAITTTEHISSTGSIDSDLATNFEGSSTLADTTEMSSQRESTISELNPTTIPTTAELTSSSSWSTILETQEPLFHSISTRPTMSVESTSNLTSTTAAITLGTISTLSSEFDYLYIDDTDTSTSSQLPTSDSSNLATASTAQEYITTETSNSTPITVATASAIRTTERATPTTSEASTATLLPTTFTTSSTTSDTTTTTMLPTTLTTSTTTSDITTTTIFPTTFTMRTTTPETTTITMLPTTRTTTPETTTTTMLQSTFTTRTTTPETTTMLPTTFTTRTTTPETTTTTMLPTIFTTRTTTPETTTTTMLPTTFTTRTTTPETTTTTMLPTTFKTRTTTPETTTTTMLPTTFTTRTTTPDTTTTTTTTEPPTTLPPIYNVVSMKDVTAYTFEPTKVHCDVKVALKWSSLSIKGKKGWRPLELKLYPDGHVSWKSKRTRHRAEYAIEDGYGDIGNNVTLDLIIDNVQCRDGDVYSCILFSEVVNTQAKSKVTTVGKPGKKIGLSLGPSIIEDRAIRLTVTWDGGFPVPWTNVTWTAVDRNNNSYDLTKYGEYTEFVLQVDDHFCRTRMQQDFVIFPKMHLNGTTIIVKPDMTRLKSFVNKEMSVELMNVEPGVQSILVIPLDYCKSGKQEKIPHPYKDCSTFVWCLPGDLVVQQCPFGTCFREKQGECL